METEKRTNRPVKKLVQGVPTVDGAGVHLTRVLGNWTMYDFDPFLMLDSFDSTRPADYIAGFPWHPHRGIETITYLVNGEIEHGDSLGNKGRINAGQAQWMCAGSGILHQEMPQPVGRLLGIQLWLNLPQAEKMTQPEYFDIGEDDIQQVWQEGADIRVVSGEYGGVRGVQPKHIPARILDISLQPGARLEVDTPRGETVFAFLLEGGGTVGGQQVSEKTAVLFADGDYVTLAAPRKDPLRVLLFSAPRLGEEIAWGGPIVMNTSEELQAAFEELDNGTFIREQPVRDAGESPAQQAEEVAERQVFDRPAMPGEDIAQPGLEAMEGHMPEPPVTLGDEERLL